MWKLYLMEAAGGGAVSGRKPVLSREKLQRGSCCEDFTGVARGPSAHLTATVSSGSTLSHFRQRNSVRPVLSVIAINRFLHFGQRVMSMTTDMA